MVGLAAFLKYKVQKPLGGIIAVKITQVYDNENTPNSRTSMKEKESKLYERTHPCFCITGK